MKIEQIWIIVKMFYIYILLSIRQKNYYNLKSQKQNYLSMWNDYGIDATAYAERQEKYIIENANNCTEHIKIVQGSKFSDYIIFEASHARNQFNHHYEKDDSAQGIFMELMGYKKNEPLETLMENGDFKIKSNIFFSTEYMPFDFCSLFFMWFGKKGDYGAGNFDSNFYHFVHIDWSNARFSMKIEAGIFSVKLNGEIIFSLNLEDKIVTFPNFVAESSFIDFFYEYCKDGVVPSEEEFQKIEFKPFRERE